MNYQPVAFANDYRARAYYLMARFHESMKDCIFLPLLLIKKSSDFSKNSDPPAMLMSKILIPNNGNFMPFAEVAKRISDPTKFKLPAHLEQYRLTYFMSEFPLHGLVTYLGIKYPEFDIAKLSDANVYDNIMIEYRSYETFMSNTIQVLMRDQSFKMEYRGVSFTELTIPSNIPKYIIRQTVQDSGYNNVVVKFLFTHRSKISMHIYMYTRGTNVLPFAADLGCTVKCNATDFIDFPTEVLLSKPITKE